MGMDENVRKFKFEGKELMIRSLKKGDKKILYEFFKSLSEKTKYFFHPHPFDKETAIKLCEEENSDVVRFITVDGNKIVGYTFLSNLKSEYPSLGICIRDDFQGRGLGKILMEHLIEVAKSMGKKGLCLTVYKDNEKGFNLYKKIGFKIERIIYAMKMEV